MRGRLLAAGALGAALLLGLAIPATASTIVRTDGNDTRSPLDLRWVRVSHGASAHVFRIATHDAVRDGRIDGERGWIRIGFGESGRWRRSVYVYLVDGELRGVVTDADRGFLRFVPARRIDRDLFEVRVPASVRGASPYRFAVWSVWSRPPCSRAAPCVDWLPSTGTIRHA